jgi:Zn-dependent membrane protease YugP
MKRRIVLTPLIYLGPLALIPIALIGIVVDILFFNFTGVVSFISVSVGLLLYVVSFLLSIMVLKTEIKAQARCLEILKAQDMANDEEIEMMKKLFKLYNIQYVNDIIMQVLEMIMRILQLMANSQRGTSAND